MNRKTPTTLTLPILLIALMIGACQQTTERINERLIKEKSKHHREPPAPINQQLAKTNSKSEDTALTPEELHQRAEAGNPEAQHELGNWYWWGHGVEQDFTQATHWIKKAANQGHAEAQYELGRQYEKGVGVTLNNKQSANWYRKAAMQGHAGAQHELGDALYRGWGVEQDKTEGRAWNLLASRQGNQHATEWLEKANANSFEEHWLMRGPKMTPAQINQAQQRAKELHEQIQTNIAQRDPAN